MEQGLDLIIGKYYSITTMKQNGFRYNPKASTGGQWKAFEKNDVRVHLNYGEYRFAYVREVGGPGMIVNGSFGITNYQREIQSNLIPSGEQ